jgi:hypothetical protein
VRALHATWGIAAGLRYTVRGHSEGFIQGGVAYDRCGRLLVLPRTVALPFSEQLPEPRVVVLRADRDHGEPAAHLELRASPDELEHGLDIVLGSVAWQERRTTWSDAGRRYVATAAPAVLTSGRIARGTLPAKGTEEHWTAVIECDAGFSRLPVYVADVGPPPPPAPGASARPRGIATVQITDRARDRFTIAVRRAGSGSDTDADAPKPVSANPDDITWIAAECQPDASVPEFYPPTGPYPGFHAEGEHR